MTPFRLLTCAAFLLPGGQLVSAARAEGPAKAAARPLLDVSAAGVEKRLVPDYNCQDIASFARSQDPAHPGLVITFQPGPQGSPGACLKPRGAPAFDLAAFGHVEARVVNTGTKTSAFFLRVDNEGDWHNAPWSTEKAYVQPGASATVKVIFGYQYGYHPGYALNPAAVVNILMFTDKSDVVQSFRVESLVAGGPAGETPPVDPASLRIPPKNGFLLGPGAALDAKTQIEAQGTQAAAAADGQSLEVVFPDAKGEQSVAVKPPVGRWDLRNATEVRVKLKNEGQTPITPNVQVTSDGGPTDLVTAAAPLAAGEETQLVASFLPAVPGKGVRVTKAGYYGNQPGTGTSFASDAAAAVRITAKHAGQAKLLVESITAAAPPAVLPDWLGKRPPVEGDWVKTFDDEFDGTSIDATKWNIYGPNYWDKTSHWSKDDVIVGGGVARLRYERKRGYHNDDPHPQEGAYIVSTSSGSNESNYAAGFLETYGKWVQRYGYFEARMKLPTAPGLWPAFWMAPDRGVRVGPQWKRQDTGNGGTELDIMEHLTRWGRYRYNIAMHLDGYGKEHIAVGSDKIYVEADKDGFITCGLLWTPGSTIYYCNGKEVFRWESPRVSSVPSDMMLTIPMGGWDNNALDDKQLPADFVIDYVRVWQRKDLASSVDGYQPAPKPEKK
jgi:beta-glucanase (GH16 family)